MSHTFEKREGVANMIREYIALAINKCISSHFPFTWLPDSFILKLKYRLRMKKKLNLDNPITFNEKLQWLKLNNRKNEYTTMVDKYEVKSYVEKKIGEKYIIPTLGIWEHFDEIDFAILPNQFVLKCTHDSGGLVIVRDKTKMNIANIRDVIEKSLKRNFYYLGREWPYKNVKPRIIAEKYMTDNGEDLEDYKIFDFNGVPKVILVCRDRFKNAGLTEDFYSDEWEHLDIERPNHPNAGENIPRLAQLEEMLEFARLLSKDIPFVRTDFYTINHKVYFGELTFYPAGGFEGFRPEEWDKKLGDWLILSLSGEVLAYKENMYILISEQAKSEGLTDYKFFCFDGYVDCVMVCIDRHLNDTKFYFFDREWNLKRLNVRGKNAPEGFTLRKPACMDEMFDIAAKLSKGIPFVRVDLYECGGKIYFGELTFYPDSGFDANLLPETDKYFGDLIKLGDKE